MVSNTKPVHLFVIDNKDNRLEVFRPLFEWMRIRGYGKVNGEYFVVETTLNLNPSGHVELLFRLLQAEGRKRGCTYNFYLIKL